MSSAWRMRWAKPCSAATRRGARNRWTRLEKAFQDGGRVTGVIFGRVKGGFTVDLDGAVAFLPGSQVDVRPVRDVGPLMNQPQPFQILKMDRRRGNIVVSRRAVLEEKRAEERSELVASLAEGQVLEGTVKNITDYGAFVDLGGVDGLLHVTDIAWRRVSHPTEVLSVGQQVTVQIIKVNQETQRISLGMKQLQTDPWEGVARQISGRRALQGQGHQRHRLRRLRGAGAGRRRPRARLRDELGEEERPSEQDRHARPGGRGDGARGRFQQAPHQPRPEAVPGKSRGPRSPSGILRARCSKARSATSPSSVCSSAFPATSTAWCISPTFPGTRPGDEAVKEYQKGQTIKVKVLDVDPEKERISLGVKQLALDPMAKVGRA